MKKILSIVTVIAMCVCFCGTAFAAEGLLDPQALSSALDGLDLSGFDVNTIEKAASDLELDLGEVDPVSAISGVLGGLFSSTDSSSQDEVPGEAPSGDTAATSTPFDSIIGALGQFDVTGALGSFVESLNMDDIKELFSGLLGSLSSEGIDLGGFSFGDFDIGSILEGNQGSGAGIAGIMDIFGGVLEMLGLDSSVIESLLDNDIVNFFANLYLGSVPGGEEETTEAPTETTTVPSTVPENPKMGDTSTVAVAMATLAFASAAAFVCTRKKHA